MISGFFKFNNGEIYYEVDGTGEPLVFLHGFSLDHRMWQNQVDYFSKNYQVVTYDLRGFGKSSLPSGDYSHQDDLNGLLDFLKIDKTNLIGLSLGGEISIDFTLKYPEYVNSLVLADSSLGGYSSKGKVDWNVYARERGLSKAKENWLNHKVFDTTKENSKALDLLKNMAIDYSGWHWMNIDLREKLSPPALNRLNEINTKTLIIVGEKDLDYYQVIAALLAKGIRKSKLIEIPESGHLVNMEQPEIFNKTLELFLEKQSFS